MSNGSPMAAKTAKARLMSMLEAKYVQSIGDAADYERGREVRVYDSWSTREQIDRREKFVRERRMLTPCEDWAVRRGYGKNPFIHDRNCKVAVHWCAVYFADGTKRMVRTLGEAREALESGLATKYWDGTQYIY